MSFKDLTVFNLIQIFTVNHHVYFIKCNLKYILKIGFHLNYIKLFNHLKVCKI